MQLELKLELENYRSVLVLVIARLCSRALWLAEDGALECVERERVEHRHGHERELRQRRSGPLSERRGARGLARTRAGAAGARALLKG